MKKGASEGRELRREGDRTGHERKGGKKSVFLFLLKEGKREWDPCFYVRGWCDERAVAF